jgi:hypothetical protein
MYQSRYSSCLFTLALIVFAVAPLNTGAAEDPDGFTQVTHRADELLRVLESLPYASEGQGPIMYTFEFSECSYCQAKYRDFKESDLGLEYRRFFVPVSDRTARETAALGKSRNSADYHAFMRHQKVAPNFDRDNDAIDAYNAIVGAASDTVPTILKQNGWNARGLVFPTYIWIEDGKVFAQGGYLKDNYANAVQRAQTGWNKASRAFFTAATGKPAPFTPSGTAAVAAPGIDPTGSSPQIATAAVTATPPVPAVLPLDELTVFMLYHKMSGDPVDFEAVARNTAKVHRANPFDQAAVLASTIKALEAAYEGANPEATYRFAVRGRLNYDINTERFESDLFAEGVYFPFQAFSVGSQDYTFHSTRDAAEYGRRVAFVNAENGRIIPLSRDRARLIDEVVRSNRAEVTAEFDVRFVGTERSRIASENALLGQVVSVRYIPGSITVLNPANWPFRDPMAIEAVPLEDAGSKLDRLDDAIVFYAYHKLAKQPIDFEEISGWMETVARAGQFDKASVQAAEAEAMRAEFAAVDVEKTYALSVNTVLNYDLERERFEVECFAPGNHVLYQGLAMMGVASNHLRGGRAQLYQQKLVIANGASARYIDVSRTDATALGDVARTGRMQATAVMEVRFVGVGDPTGAVGGDNIVRAEALSLVFDGLDSPVPLEPYDPNALKTVAVSDFDIMGLRVGQNLKSFQKQVAKEFGEVGTISPPRNDDPRFKSGVGHDPNGCYSFGNDVPEVGNVCIRAYADDNGTIRKIVVEQILEGIDWEPTRVLLLGKYGAMAYALRQGNVQHYAWGPAVTKSVTGDYQSQPAYAVTASLSVMQSMLDRSSASTRASTNLRIRLIDPDWAGPPDAAPPPALPEKSGPRL